MQSNGARVLVALGSIAAIVVLLIIFTGGDDDTDSSTTVGETTATDSGGAQTTAKPAASDFAVINVVGGEPEGGVQELTYSKGDQIRIEVKSDTADEVHVHGYDLMEDVEAGGKVRFDFPATIEGVFEVELEDAKVQLAELTVKP